MKLFPNGMLLFILLLIPFLYAEENIAILSRDSNSITFELKAPAFTLQNVFLSMGRYQRIDLVSWAKTTEAGSPELPLKGVLVEVPGEGALSIEVLSDAYRVIPGCKICPVPRLSLEEGIPVEDHFLGKSYETNQFYPSKLATIEGRANLRGVCLAQIKIHPFRWNPKTGEFRHSTHMRLRIRYENALSENRGRNLNPLYENLWKDMVLGYQPKGLKEKEQEEFPIQEEDSRDFEPPISAQKGCKLEIRQNGLYQITYEDLAVLGISPSEIHPSTFRLFCSGQEVSCEVLCQNPSRFSPGDSIRFYAEKAMTSFTHTNAYWLYWGEGVGKDIEKRSGTSTNPGNKVDFVLETLAFEENRIFWNAMPGALEEDHWFWKRMTAPERNEYRFFIPDPIPTSKVARVQVHFYGLSNTPTKPNHHTRIFWNGTLVSDQFWKDTSPHVQAFTLPAGLLLPGTNTMTIELPGDTGSAIDTIYFNRVEISYERHLIAAQDIRRFLVPPQGRCEIESSHWSSPQILLYDITKPWAVQEMIGFTVTQEGDFFKATFEDSFLEMKSYWMMTESRIAKPHSLQLWQNANLRSPLNEADWIAITAKAFLPALEPLCEWHRNHGLRVKAVAVEDIYDEFNFGLFEPKAIHRFLQYAYRNWQSPAPTYVLLLGDATIDYKNDLNTGKKNIVPAIFSQTVDGIVPDDNFYACVEGDDSFADLFLGRIPAGTQEDVENIVQKTLRFAGASGPSKSVLFVADNNDTTFDAVGERLRQQILSEVASPKVYLRSYSDMTKAHADIVSYLNQGMMITTYLGHGTVTGWAGEKIMEVSHIPSLENGENLTFVWAFTCLNNYFSHSAQHCIGEAFIAAPNQGAIGYFSCCNLGYLWEHELIAKKALTYVFSEKQKTFGYITTKAKLAAHGLGASLDMLKTFPLLGDPAMKLKDGEGE